MDVVPTENSNRSRHSDIRMVHIGVDFRVERNAVLRRHLPGREQNAQNRVVLDQFHVLRHIHDRVSAEMDSVGNSQIFQKFLDGFGFYHRNGNVKGNRNVDCRTS